MSTRIEFGLSKKSIAKAMRQLEKYKKSLAKKCVKFNEELARKGILVAEQNVGNYGRYITFAIETDPNTYGATTLMVATNTGHITAQWLVPGEGGQYEVREADVSPLMMAEFGSGVRRANNVRASEFGMGAGTFPDQTHAFDPDGWWYMDLEGVWHHSYGVSPTMPMWMAAIEMIDLIETTAKEVFGT